ncbi:MAG: response regulator [Gammaproteobacteria bacterium]|nr:response regulator [Gammaproteobacteria bacterium]
MDNNKPTNKIDSNILLVCNNPIECGVIQKELSKSNGLKFDLASSAKEAISKLNTGKYESVVIEPDLPDMDGWKLCRLIRSSILNVEETIPLVVVSRTYSKRVTEAMAREFEVDVFVNLNDIYKLTETLTNLDGKNTRLYRAKVLVIEDAEDTVNLIKRFLDNRYEIDVQMDGESGLKAWQEGDYDLVLLDIMLPKLSGIDVLSVISEEDPLQSVVIMTAHCDQKMASELMLAGATDFISKPFSASQLRKICDIAIHREDYLISQKQINGGVTNLINSESKYRRLVESLSEEHFIYTQSPDGDFTYISPSVEPMMGYSATEFTNNFKAYLTASSKNEDSLKYHQACLMGEMQPKFEVEVIKKDGSLCQLEVVETPEIVDEKVIAVHGIAHDVTSRVERTDLLKTLAHATFEGILIHEDGLIVEVNHTVEQMFDVGRYGLIASDFRMLIAEEQRDVVMEVLNTNQEASVETIGLRHDQTYFPIKIRIRKVQFNNREINVIALEDLTDQRKAEKERETFQKQLRQAQKMESIGHLTGGIAHDFNNILASIQGYTGLSLEMFGHDPKLNQYLTEVSKASERARVLISQMLAFSRGGTSETKPLELTPHIRDAIKMLRSTMPSSIVIRDELTDDFPPAMVDAVQFHQIIMNICINSRDAIDNSEGVIDLSISHVNNEGQICSSCHKHIEGDFLTVKIRDTGKGMDSQTLNKIFDPFYTTKDVDKGTGMGLSVVHGIIHDHKGHVFVNTKPGEGTEFQLMFPVSHEDVVETDKSSSVVTETGKGNIMVVDDDNDLAGFLQEMLTQRGYKVELFVDPCKALGAFESSPGNYDLVLTDQTMPILPGHKLAKALRKKRPDIPIIICTGYSDVMDEEKSREMKISGFLQKPVESNQLVNMINTLIIPDNNTVKSIMH